MKLNDTQARHISEDIMNIPYSHHDRAVKYEGYSNPCIHFYQGMSHYTFRIDITNGQVSMPNQEMIDTMTNSIIKNSDKILSYANNLPNNLDGFRDLISIAKKNMVKAKKDIERIEKLRKQVINYLKSQNLL